jgi:hypothetical protein
MGPALAFLFGFGVGGVFASIAIVVLFYLGDGDS